jgi:epoxyqueuosine reductase
MDESEKVPAELQNDYASIIVEKINEFVRNSPANRLSFLDHSTIFDQPLVRFADGDDAIFHKYKSIISPNHLTPREALSAAHHGTKNISVRVSVISWILPITEKTRASNRTNSSIPSRLWSHTRWYGEKFNNALRTYIVELLFSMGYKATAPMLQPYFKIESNDKGAYSNWSERHLAYAAGHGTFSLSDGFITEVGIAHRCGSVVTDLVLPASPMTAKNPFSNCLFHLGVNCRSCIKRCPAGAITEKGHDKNRCQEYMHSFGYGPTQINNYDNNKTIVGCGLCQTKVPCEYENPASKIKKKTGNY